MVRDLEPLSMGRSLPDAARGLRRDDAEALGARRMTAPESLHTPVLVDDIVRWLAPVPAGTWIVDGTVGLGGHAAALLAQASESRLLGLDRDVETLALASRRLAPFGARCVLRHADFRHLETEARACGAAPAHAVLLDLGLSSFQLERSGRGFSFQSDEGL